MTNSAIPDPFDDEQEGGINMRARSDGGHVHHGVEQVLARDERAYASHQRDLTERVPAEPGDGPVNVNGLPVQYSTDASPAVAHLRAQDAYLAVSTNIDPAELSAEFARAPADLAYWHAQYANAHRYWRERELSLETCAANVSRRIRQALAAKGTARVSVAEVEEQLYADTDYLQRRQKLNNAEAEKERLRGVVEAVRTKANMLVSLGAHQRAEMAADPVVRARNGVEAEVRRGGRGVG